MLNEYLTQLYATDTKTIQQHTVLEFIENNKTIKIIPVFLDNCNVLVIGVSTLNTMVTNLRDIDFIKFLKQNHKEDIYDTYSF